MIQPVISNEENVLDELNGIQIPSTDVVTQSMKPMIIAMNPFLDESCDSEDDTAGSGLIGNEKVNALIKRCSKKKP